MLEIHNPKGLQPANCKLHWDGLQDAKLFLYPLMHKCRVTWFYIELPNMAR